MNGSDDKTGTEKYILFNNLVIKVKKKKKKCQAVKRPVNEFVKYREETLEWHKHHYFNRHEQPNTVSECQNISHTMTIISKESGSYPYYRR
jgi:hypothetical protein